MSQLTARSKTEMVSTIEGNSGNDTIIVRWVRDRADGGAGSDTIYGFAGDDKLIGDSGEGFSTDVDTMYAGQGNDDLRGGVGINSLYAWSMNPFHVDGDFECSSMRMAHSWIKLANCI